MKRKRNIVAVIMAVDAVATTGRGRKVLFSSKILRKLGCHVLLYTPNTDIKNYIKKHISIPRYPEVYQQGFLNNVIFELKLFIKYFKSIFLDLLKRKPILIQIHGVTRAAPQILALLAAKLVGSKIVYYYHDLLPETFITLRGGSSKSLAYYVILLFERIMAKFSDVVICVSDVQAYIVSKRNKKNEVAVVYPFVDIDEFKGCEQESRDILIKYGLSSDYKYLIYLGRLEPQTRGLELLLEAYKSLVNRLGKNEKIMLLLVGDGPLKEHITNFIKVNGLEKMVCLLGEIQHKDAVKILCAADIAILSAPKRKVLETLMPTKLLEYMAAGKIIIAPNYTQVRLILNGCGLFFEPGNVVDLEQKILSAFKVLSDNEKVLTIRRCLQNRLKNLLNSDQRLSNIYKQVLLGR